MRNSAADDLTIYCVYVRPRDYPRHVVVRPWTLKGQRMEASAEALLFETLEDARDHLNGLGLFNLGRYVQDDPAIAEAWI